MVFGDALSSHGDIAFSVVSQHVLRSHAPQGTLQQMSSSEETPIGRNVSCEASGLSPTPLDNAHAKATATEDGQVEKQCFVSGTGVQFRRSDQHFPLHCDVVSPLCT